MISVCTMFYPWYREYDRTEEIFDALISSMTKCDRKEELELSVVDAGVTDVWKLKSPKRYHNNQAFYERVKKEWGGQLIYRYTSKGIHWKDDVPRFWAARAIELAVLQSRSDRILTIGMDTTVPKNFVDFYYQNVDYGKVFTLIPWQLRRDMSRTNREGYGNWYGAKGITCCMKNDYIKAGGTDYHTHIKDRADSTRYLRLKKMFDLKDVKLPGVLHIDHPGTNHGTSEFKGTWKIPPKIKERKNGS